MNVPIALRPTVFEAQTAYAWNTSHMGDRETTAFLIEHLTLHSDMRVLDIGCGPGSSCCDIAVRFGCRVVGVDRSHYQVTVATSRARSYGLADRVTFATVDAQRLPFADASFDAVLVQSVFAFVRMPERAVAEIARVLRSGGRLAWSEATTGPGLPPLPATRRMLAQGYDYRLRAPDAWRGLLDDAGLRVIRDVRHPGGYEPGLRESLMHWSRYTAKLALRSWRRTIRSPRHWADALVFFDLFRVFAVRSVPYILLIAEQPDVADTPLTCHEAVSWDRPLSRTGQATRVDALLGG